MGDKEWKGKVELAEETAQQLADTYYEMIDKKRQQIHRFYSEQAILSWDGNKEKTQVIEYKKYGYFR
jgi:hypothetical protein